MINDNIRILGEFESGILTDEKLDGLPNECPLCHAKISPEPILASDCSANGSSYAPNKKQIVLLCTNFECGELFIAYYMRERANAILKLTDIKPKCAKVNIPENIYVISQRFIKIYLQSVEADNMGLDEICGIGFRKAIEFLIKDYAIKNNPNEKREILDTPLGGCINKYVDDTRIKSIVERAVWLGNDETHYERKWLDKDIKDLKVLIELTLYWIQMDILSNKYLSEMSTGKVKK